MEKVYKMDLTLKRIDVDFNNEDIKDFYKQMDKYKFTLTGETSLKFIEKLAMYIEKETGTKSYECSNDIEKILEKEITEDDYQMTEKGYEPRDTSKDNEGIEKLSN